MEQLVDRLSLINSMKLLSIMDKHFVFDPSTIFCAEIDEPAWRILSEYQHAANGRSPSEVVTALKEDFSSDLVDSVLNEWNILAESQRLGEPEKTTYPEWKPNAKFGMLTISFHECNLRCSYCFAKYGTYDNGARRMNKETARKAIDFFLEGSIDQDLSITFFGGEPLTDIPLFFYATEYALRQAKDLGKKVRFHLTTNGTLLNDEVADFLVKNDFSLIVSVDGPPHLHDEHRCFPNKKGSHDIILKNLERVRNTKTARLTTLRATFTPARIALTERVLYLTDLVDRGYAANCSVEPTSLPPDSPLAFNPVSGRNLRKEYEELVPIYLARAREGRPIRFHHFDIFVRRVIGGHRSTNECGAGIGFMVVNPLEEIYACHHESHSLIGNLDEGIDPALQEQWRLNDIRHRRPCPTCWARYLCGGGCRHDAILHCGDSAQPDPASCTFKKELIRVAIWLAAGMTREAWWEIICGKEQAGMFENALENSSGGGAHDDNS